MQRYFVAKDPDYWANVRTLATSSVGCMYNNNQRLGRTRTTKSIRRAAVSDRQSLQRGRRPTLGTLVYICPRMCVQPSSPRLLMRVPMLIARCIDSTSTTFQPFFLNLHRVHALALHFFLRMWNESGASAHDFPRLVALTRSQCVFLSSRLMARPLSAPRRCLNQGEGRVEAGEHPAVA